jgi:hypothetical protein
MNYRPACVMRSWTLFAAMTIISYAQAPQDKRLAEPDNWQRSKECAAQAEKVMTASDRENVSKGFSGALHWENHYSLKYGKCFVSALYMESGKRPSGEKFSFYSTILTDAFERHSLAMSATSGAPAGLCTIGEATVACKEAAGFIADHMKN